MQNVANINPAEIAAMCAANLADVDQKIRALSLQRDEIELQINVLKNRREQLKLDIETLGRRIFFTNMIQAEQNAPGNGGNGGMMSPEKRALLEREKKVIAEMKAIEEESGKDLSEEERKNLVERKEAVDAEVVAIREESRALVEKERAATENVDNK